jgi:hypothetical protein
LLVGDILGEDGNAGRVLDLDFSVVRHDCGCRCGREKEDWASKIVSLSQEIIEVFEWDQFRCSLGPPIVR